MYFLNESVSMDKIPHIDSMSYSQVKKVFGSNNWSFTQKMDGFNVSFGISEGSIFIKPKTGKEFKSLAELETLSKRLPYFEAFKRFYEALENSDFKEKYENIANGENIVFFGELLGSKRQNVVLYSEDAIGEGAVVLFGVKIDNQESIDITNESKGQNLIQDMCNQMIESESMKWNFYTAKPIDINVDITEIQKFIRENDKILSSRKRDEKSKLFKKIKLNELQCLIAKMKVKLLDDLAKETPFLGAEKLEGAVVRNKDTGALTKIVDKDFFSALNKAAWFGRTNATQLTKQFVNEVHIKILKGTDQIWESKVIDLINQYLCHKDADKFVSESELIEVLQCEYLQEHNEIPEVTKKLSILAKDYYKKMVDLKTEIAAKQSTIERIDEDNYKKTISFMTEEVKEMNRLINKMNENVYGRCIWFCLSEKLKAKIRNKYL
jgi:hypothetical protein